VKQPKNQALSYGPLSRRSYCDTSFPNHDICLPKLGCKFSKLWQDRRFTYLVDLNTIIKCKKWEIPLFGIEIFFTDIMYMSQTTFKSSSYFLWLYNTVFRKTLASFMATKYLTQTCKLIQTLFPHVILWARLYVWINLCWWVMTVTWHKAALQCYNVCRDGNLFTIKT
jgi:hypothetical protein